jgi:hypothetical protein
VGYRTNNDRNTDKGEVGGSSPPGPPSKSGPGPVAADLVIDATGRGSNSASWLEAVGYRKLKEESIEAR